MISFLEKRNSQKIPARLVLSSGEVYEGFSFAWQKDSYFGEVVFTTGMVGYVESLTDPSYKGQLLTFTFPLIGNYGVPKKEFWESEKIQASGVVIDCLSPIYEHYAAEQSFRAWLEAQKVPLIFGVDTRALTKTLRKGASMGAIVQGKTLPTAFIDPNQSHLVAEVSTRQIKEYGKGKKKIIAVDCGIKENILRSLLQFPVTIKRVPFDYDYSQEEYDGLFISNGPGDPAMCKETIAILKKALFSKKPIFGICLGTQLIALSTGAKTYKLPFGHRGQNQPCQSTDGKCYLTSQNHGYAIVEESLPRDWSVSFRNLNDLSIEGIQHKTRPIFAVQFHPEAAPGPLDTSFLFQQFYEML
ncbi:MAG TPA: glutamine-hydrolyzing carbamoyl-phosphate synthase small subunit [Rhabdochlamydiaceae bacterium]|nr:glutamine-hydrolyzing carbamoyl-phosphate synthase small subunit [Rhabdochlamydiaceae bacterium]